MQVVQNFGNIWYHAVLPNVLHNGSMVFFKLLFFVLEQCYLRGTLYDHGEQVALKQCIECTCKDGNMKCDRIDPNTMCPPLPCPPEDQFSVDGECCKFCRGIK